MIHMTNTYFESTRGVVIAHMNAHIPANILVLKTEFDDCGIDCLSISETWLHETVPDSLPNLCSFNLLRHDRQTLDKDGETQTGGGLKT